MNTNQPYITTTQHWLSTIVIAYNLCPFAKAEQERNSIRFTVTHDVDIETCLLHLIQECQQLDINDDIETTLLIYTKAFGDFDDYLDFLALAEDLLIEQGYEGEYQLASFHPNYYFDGENIDEPSNYTNRSPYPMLHLLRETSIEHAVNNHPDIDSIPQRNIKLTQSLGSAKLQSLLASCYPTKS